MLEKVDARVLDRFCLAKKIGSGAYGIVWKGVDKKNGRAVALKKCFDCFRNSVDARESPRLCELFYTTADTLNRKLKKGHTASANTLEN